jgi:hypothetical protein
MLFDDAVDLGAAEALLVEDAADDDRFGKGLGRVIARACHAVELFPKPEGINDLRGAWEE